VKLIVLELGMDVIDGVLALDEPLEVLLDQEHALILALVQLLLEKAQAPSEILKRRALVHVA